MKLTILFLLLFCFSLKSKATPGCQLPSGDFYTQLVSGTNYTGTAVAWENSPGVMGCRAHITGGVVSACSVNSPGNGGILYDVSIDCSLDHSIIPFAGIFVLLSSFLLRKTALFSGH